MTYIEILTEINNASGSTDIKQLLIEINNLKDAEERYSAEDALYRAAHLMSDYQRNYLARQGSINKH
jgi:hypothetical protein